jgi:Beta-propeller repeat
MNPRSKALIAALTVTAIAFCLGTRGLPQISQDDVPTKHPTTSVRGGAKQSESRKGLVGAKGASLGGNREFDPVLVYSTLFGGPTTSAAASLVDSSGNLYFASAGPIPVTTGIPTSQCQFCWSVAKLDPTGQTLLFATYVPGLEVTAMTVDSSGNIYVAGLVPGQKPSVPRPSQPTLPIPPGSTPFQAAPKGLNLGVVKLNSAGTILAATYLGGSNTEGISGLAVDPSGNVFVAGVTNSNDFPTTSNVLQTSLMSTQNFFVSKLNASLSALVYSTYLGGTSSVSVNLAPFVTASGAGLVIDGSGDAYITGSAVAGFPTTGNAVQSGCANNPQVAVPACGFVSKLNPTGTALLYSTLLGLPLTAPNAIAIDSAQNIYVGGAAPMGYPEVHALQPCLGGSTQPGAFVSEINSSGALTFSTCLGQFGYVTDLVTEATGNVAVVGRAYGLLLANPIQVNSDDQGDFVASISANANSPALLFSSYIGGGQIGEIDDPGAVAVDPAGDIYVVGAASPAEVPIDVIPVFNALQPVITPDADGTYNSGHSAAFIQKIAPTNAAAAAVTPGAIAFGAQQVGSPASHKPSP